MITVKNFIKAHKHCWFRKKKRGQTLVEYSIILALVSTLVISVLIGLGKNTSSMYSMINSNIEAPTAQSFAH